MKTGFVGFIRSHAFLVFLVLTLAISWFPWFTGQGGLLVFGPSIAGLIMIAITGGRDGLRELVKSAVRAKAKILWWLVALLVPCAIAFAAILAGYLTGGGLPGFEFFKSAWYMAPVFFLMTIVGGPLGEEIGWRGFSLPYLQKKWGPLRAGLIVGAAWGLWHIPQFLTEGTLHYGLGLRCLPLFVLGELSLSVVMAWIYNNTGSSLLLAGFLFHNADNFWGVVLTTNATMESVLQGADSAADANLWVLSIAAYAIFAAALIIVTKGRLGLKKEPALESQAAEKSA